MTGFEVLFPALMLAAPALFIGLWCHWTGAGRMLPTLLATLAALILWAAAACFAPGIAAAGGFRTPFAMGGLLAIVWGFGVPAIRRALAELPATPTAASLRRREVRLPGAAWIVPAVSWAGITAWLALGGARMPLWWLGSLLGLGGLVGLRALLPRMVLEPEPLGGPDPEGLARRYEEFRDRRVRGMYLLMAPLLLCVSAVGALPAGPAGGVIGGVAGASIGVLGALFGTWADAQRYLLRRQLSGTPPPG